MAWRNLGRNKVRTALAALGIIIGVVAISSLGIAGVALQEQATSNLGSLTNEVTITDGQDSEYDGITDDQLEGIQDVVTGADVVPEKSDSTTLTSRSGEELFVTVTAITQADVLYNVSQGESPERLQSGALITNSAARALDLEIGDPVEYDGQLYRIRGLITTEGGFAPGGFNELVVPMSALSEENYYDSVTIVTEGGESATRVAESVENRFNQDEEILNIRSFADAQEQIGSFLNTLSMGMLGIGSISLLVASVAILNVMLMSTIERRGEIGVLRAVGIRRGEVLRMILTESALLGAVGGVVGVTLSLIIGLIIFQLLTGDLFGVFTWASMQYLIYGFGFALAASLLSGLYPAWKAANDPPVESLRS